MLQNAIPNGLMNYQTCMGFIQINLLHHQYYNISNPHGGLRAPCVFTYLNPK